MKVKYTEIQKIELELHMMYITFLLIDFLEKTYQKTKKIELNYSAAKRNAYTDCHRFLKDFLYNSKIYTNFSELHIIVPSTIIINQY